MIRTYQPTDQDRLLELLRLNTPAYFAPEEEADFIRYLGLHPDEHYVWEENGIVLGCAGGNWYPNSDDGRVSWFIVDPNTQGKGVGMKLLGHCLDQLRTNPKTKVIIVRTSQMAEGFFARGGFKTVRKEKDYWAPGFDLVYMEMRVKW
ncbi:MAG: GNAT family N-acetyltransferase [Bacteroidota bacterium]